jgi:hypothetical protein
MGLLFGKPTGGLLFFGETGSESLHIKMARDYPNTP